jgi:hypothetical protein
LVTDVAVIVLVMTTEAVAVADALPLMAAVLVDTEL